MNHESSMIIQINQICHFLLVQHNMITKIIPTAIPSAHPIPVLTSNLTWITEGIGIILIHLSLPLQHRPPINQLILLIQCLITFHNLHPQLISRLLLIQKWPYLNLFLLKYHRIHSNPIFYHQQFTTSIIMQHLSIQLQT